MQHIRDDFHQAWRSWTASFKSGRSTIPVILTLVIAIGATMAAFVLVSSLLNILPYSHSEQLVMLWETVQPKGPKALRVSIPDYQDFQNQNKTFQSLGLFAPGSHNLLIENNAERISSPQVSAGFFNVLGVRMLMGRDATPDDTSAVLLSERLWHSRFPGWQDPIGKTVRVDGVDRIVIGIVPHAQEFPATAEMWIPFVPTVETCSCKRNGHSYQVIGRLKDGVSVAQADAEIRGIAARLASQYPDTNKETGAWVEPLRQRLIGDIKPAMWMLVGATTALLLMACISVAAILFARGADRGPEIAMRQVLGARRSRIMRQLLIESSFSAVTASILGVLVGWWILQLYLRIVPGSLPQIKASSIGPLAVVFAIAISLVAVIGFSLLPALYTTRVSLLVGMRGQYLPGTLGSSQKFRKSLIVLENTVAFAMLVCTILLLNSLVRLTNVNPGFSSRGLVSADLTLNSQRYATPQQVAPFFQTLLQRVRALPTVESAAAVDSLPMTGSTEGTAYYPMGSFDRRTGEEPIARVTYVTSDYFKTMSIPLLRGRDFSASDGVQSHVMVISEGIARANWPNENPIGKRIGIRGADSISWEVIGLVPDIKDDGFAAASPPRLYLNEQEAGERDMTIVMRTTGEAAGVINSLRHEVSALDSTLPIYNVQSVEEVVNESLARNRVVTRIVGAFSVMSLILAAVGVYGVILSNLVRRTREFGIRIAIGSTLRHIAWLLFREGLLLVVIGIVAGVFVAFASSRSLRSLLYGVGTVDILSYLMAIAAQLMIVIGGCLVLLGKISKLDPIVALKNR